MPLLRREESELTFTYLLFTSLARRSATTYRIICLDTAIRHYGVPRHGVPMAGGAR